MKEEDLSCETKCGLKDSTASKYTQPAVLDQHVITIDTSAKKPGKSGIPGKGGWRAGDGSRGKRGLDAEDIFIRLVADEKAQKARVVRAGESNSSSNMSLPLGDSNSAIHLKANGGAGGDGGNGGSGSKGLSGRDGRDATSRSRGTNGSPGRRGGNGGNGGRGGNGGCGGDIRVIVASQDMDLVMLVDEDVISMQGGLGGRGGSKGPGGCGGEGGSGGCPYFWTTRHHGEYGTTLKHHTKRGGKAGPDGPDGMPGQKGPDGRRGKPGIYAIYISDIDKEYSGCYHLTWQSHKLVESKGGVIEPGDKLSIRNITFKNNGKMPTPEFQPIRIYLKNNKWVSYEESNLLLISESIAIGGKYKLPQRLTFSVKDNGFPMAINSTFRQIASVDYGARVLRVNKSFKSVTKKPATFVVSYPVEIAPVAAVDAVTLGGEAPFAVKLCNVSKHAIGIKADKPRLLELNLRVNKGVSGEDIQFHNKRGKLKYLFNDAHKPIKKLLPKGTSFFSGTLKFKNKAIPLYTTVEFKVGLELGNIYQPTKQLQRIQERTFTIQLTESYQFDPEADFVLVINKDTTRKEIRRWEKMAHTLGTRVSKWNVSLYSGFSYFKNLKGKVVIFLNNSFRIQKTQTNKRATNYVNHLEIFKAAKATKIATYVKGSGFSMFEIQDPLAEADYENKSVKSAVHEGLPQGRAYIAHRDISDEAVHQLKSNDVYAIIKLLPLSKKLDYITRVLKNSTYRKILKKAILSDLIDELIMFRKSKWSGSLPREKLKKSLKVLEAFSAYDYSGVVEDEAGKAFVNSLLVFYTIIAKKLPSNFDKKFYRRRARILSDIVCSKVREMRKQYELVPNYDFYLIKATNEKLNSKQFLKYWKNKSRKEILEQHSTPSPYNDIIFNIHLGFDVSPSCYELQKTDSNEKTIVENPFLFASDSERRKVIKTFEKNCQFERDSDQVVIKPGISRKSKLQKVKKSKTKSKGKSKVRLFDQTGPNSRSTSCSSTEIACSNPEDSKLQI